MAAAPAPFTTNFTFSISFHQLQGIQQCSAGNDSRTMLIIVHDRDLQLFAQPFFNGKTFRAFDIFQVDAAEK